VENSNFGFNEWKRNGLIKEKEIVIGKNP